MSTIIIRELYLDTICNNTLACINFEIYDTYLNVYFNRYFDEIGGLIFEKIKLSHDYDITKVLKCIEDEIINIYCPFLRYSKDYVKDDFWYFADSPYSNGFISKIEDNYKFSFLS